MSNSLPERFFEELAAKLRATGLPDHQVRSFVAHYREFQNHDPAHFEIFKNHQMPSEDCFKTLAEAQKIFAVHADKIEYSKELSFVSRYLEVPYSNVAAAKKAMADSFNRSDADIDATYFQDSEWLFITADAVNAFAAYLKSKFSDLEFVWSIYKKAALLGLEKTQYRINTVLKILGPEVGEKVLRKDLQGDAWLFYLWFTDPVGCIEYMLECGLTPEKVLYLLECEPRFLFEYKEGRKHKYHHDQSYIDFVIRKYLN